MPGGRPPGGTRRAGPSPSPRGAPARFTTPLGTVRVPRPGPGRPRTRPAHVAGDQGCSSKAIPARLRQRSTARTVPERADRIADRIRRGRPAGRPPSSDEQPRKRRNVAERCFGRLKRWRGIATRYDRTAGCCRAVVTPASFLTRVRSSTAGP
ncbi:hypothetical protein GCM10015536_65760 [Streptomyces griseomycini]|nr:hypothetical protein GCM10015536_65760 [Streptomyces griseomycini]